MSDPILTLDHVSVDFQMQDHVVSAVSDVSLAVRPREIVGIVGESGCGKSTLAMATMGLLGSQARVRGNVVFEGRDLVALSEEERRALRGDRMAMIFQDALTSLDPTYAVGEQVAEAIRAHRDVTKAQAKDASAEAVARRGHPGAGAPLRRTATSPVRRHAATSGGRRGASQSTRRCSSPTSRPPRSTSPSRRRSWSCLLAMRERARHGDPVDHARPRRGRPGLRPGGGDVCRAAGRDGAQDRALRAPRHPYTQALLAAQPTSGLERGRLRVIGGEVPDLSAPPPGCRFAPRCALAFDACGVTPVLEVVGPEHRAACWAVAPGSAPTSAGQASDPIVPFAGVGS